MAFWWSFRSRRHERPSTHFAGSSRRRPPSGLRSIPTAELKSRWESVSSRRGHSVRRGTRDLTFTAMHSTSCSRRQRLSSLSHRSSLQDSSSVVRQPPNKRLKLPAARRLWNESFFSAPQLKRDSLGGCTYYRVYSRRASGDWCGSRRYLP